MPVFDLIDGRFETIRRLGGGGYGDVWLARDTRLQRNVAVKVLRTNSTSNRAAFEREARMTAALEHDHIVRLYDFGHATNFGNYLVFEFISGDSFDKRLSEFAKLPPEQRLLHASLIMLHVALALAEAHRNRIVHRDVKPENILLTGPSLLSRAKLGDFGIAAMAGDVGTLRKTFRYASPEQLDNQRLEPASDLYSLGVTLYEALAGHKPHEAENPLSLIAAIRHGRRKPLPKEIRTAAPELDALVDRMLAVDIQARPSIEDTVRVLRRQLAADAATVDAALTAPAAQKVDLIETIELDPEAFRSSGVNAMYDSRDRFSSDYPIDALLHQLGSNGELMIVGRTLRNVLDWSGSLHAALMRGASVRMCLLHPDAASTFTAPAITREEIFASIAKFRTMMHPHIQQKAPSGKLRLSFHRNAGTDAFFHIRCDNFTFASWEITSTRNRARSRTLVVNPQVGLGRDLAERYDTIAGLAEQDSLIYSYERGSLVNRLPK